MSTFDLNPEQTSAEQGQQPAPQPAQQPQPQPAPQSLNNNEDYARFEQYMRQYLGADPVQIRQALLQQQQNTVEFQRQRLRQEWGDNYDANFAAVQTRLQEIAKTNPQRAQSLADAEGALMLHRAMQYEELSSQQQGASVLQQGGLNRSTTPASPSANNFQFTASQIRDMSPDERRANHAAIQAAYQQGLVDRNQ
jgi:hypothetical protein